MRKLPPKLRFKQDDGSAFPEWEEKRLEDVSVIIGGGTPDTTIHSYWNGNISWFTPSEITAKYLDNSKRTISPLGLKNSSAKLLPVGTLLLSSRATVGEIGIATQQCTTNQGFQSLVVNNDQSNEFIYYWVNRNKKEFLIRSAGSTFLEISKAEVAKISLNVPTLPEQQKIADFLSSVDAKIDAVKRKCDAFERYKKGLMQQIFSQKIRFKQDDGSDFPEWEEKRLGDVYTLTRGQVLAMGKVASQATHEAPYPVYSSQTKSNGLAGFYKDFLFQDAITWTTDGANAGDTKYRQGSFYCTNVCGVLISHDGHANLCMAELINSISKNYVSYVGNPKLMNNVMSQIKLRMPSLEEQQKIADFLSAIDAKIDAIKAQVEKLEVFKKGLLQQMLV